MPRPRPNFRFAPSVETLEDRATPATHTWDGGANADNWSDDANWVGDDGPTVGETNVIIVFNTAAGTTLQDIVNLQVRTLRFDAGATAVVQLDTDTTLDGTGTADTIVDSTGTNSITGTGDLVLTGGAVTFLVDDTNGRLVIAANLSGPQGLTKTGGGVLELTAVSANTYAGVTTVAEGVLALNTSTADAGVSNVVVVGDGTGAAESAVLRLRNIFEIPDAAAVTVQDDGLIELTGSFTEDVESLTLNGGVVRIGSGSTFRLFGDAVTVTASGTTSLIEGAGLFSLTGTTTFAVEDGDAGPDLEVSARLADSAAGIVKTGPGRMVLSANNDYGSTLVTEGELDVDGLQPNDPVTVTGGTFGGGGQVGTVTVTGGTLSPGSAAGLIGTNGVQTGSRLQADTTTLTDATFATAVFTAAASQGSILTNVNSLSVTGTLSLTNVALTLARVGPASVVGRPYVIVQNDGTDPVTGTFTGIAEGGSLVVSGQTFFVTYVGGDGNDVVLIAGPVDPSINQIPVAVDDTTATRPGEAVRVAVLANDEDANGDALVVTAVGLPLNGAAVRSGGDVVYTPAAGFTGTDSFTYTISDGRGGTATATVTVLVTDGPLPNRDPAAANDSAATAPGTSVRVPVLANDTDQDGDALTVAVAAADQPANGSAVANADGTITFTPAPGFTGVTTFTYTVSDGRDGSVAARAVVTVTVRAGGGGPARQIAVGLDRGGDGTARLVNPDRSARATAAPFIGAAQSGVRTAAADFNGDGVADLVVGTGPNGVTRVRVLDGVTQNELFTVQPFEDAFTGGVFVAAGDVTGDGVADLVVTPDEGGGPRVRIFSGGANFAQVADFFGIQDTNFRGGARAAVGDVNGDGVGDLIVSAGFGGGPRVAGFDGTSLADGALTRKLFPDFFAFEQGLRNGVFVAAGDVDGDGLAELVVGGGPGGGPRVTAFSGAGLLTGRQTQVANFFAGNPANRGGVRVAVKNLDGDALADIVTGSGPTGGSRVTAYAGTTVTSRTPAELFALDAQPGFTGGVFVG